jgi:hypothetical protein
VLDEGFAASNVAFGMGGGLLQKMDRDTMSFACKLSHIIDPDGTERNVMKTPKTASSKVQRKALLCCALALLVGASPLRSLVVSVCPGREACGVWLCWRCLVCAARATPPTRANTLPLLLLCTNAQQKQGIT